MKDINLLMNYQTDEPTLSGHIYPKDVMARAFEAALANGKTVPIFKDWQSTDVIDIVGTVSGYSIDTDGNISMSGNIIQSAFKKDMQLSSVCIGCIGEEDKTVYDLELKSFLPITDEDLKLSVTDHVEV